MTLWLCDANMTDAEFPELKIDEFSDAMYEFLLLSVLHSSISLQPAGAFSTHE